MSSTWLEEDEFARRLLRDDVTPLPVSADDSCYELDSDFRPQVLMSVGSARSGNFFSSRTQAAVYGQSLATLLKLRRVPGVIAYRPGAAIIVLEDGEVFARETDGPEFSVSGYFDSLDLAESAIDTIGRAQIALAVKTLMCIT